MSRVLSGRLVFRQAGPPRPVARMPFVATLHHALFPDRNLTAGETDADGRFSFPVVDPGGDGWTARLTLRASSRTYRPDGSPVDTTCDVGEVDLPLDEGAELGDIPTAYWPYRTDFPTPRVAKVNGKLPQSYTKGYAATLAGAVARTAPVTTMLKGLNALDKDLPSMAQIQAPQPKTLTLRVEAEHPGRTRSDAWLGDQLLNGFDIALRVGKDAEDPARFRVRIAWGDMPSTGPFDLTDVDVVLEPRGAEVVPTRITLRIRQPGANGAWKSDTTTTFTPKDGARWEQAKRVVRCQYLLHGALEGHITRAHLPTEMYTIAATRNLRRNPVRHVLFPHLEEIVAQDNDGDNFAWGPHGILANGSALTFPVLQRRMQRAMAGWDWTTFRPRSVLHPSHRYAKACALYWEVLTEYLEGWFAQNGGAVAAEWSEILAFSNDLVEHSLPFEAAEEDPLVIPADTNELDDPTIPRVVVGGAIRSQRPVTTTATPAPGEMEKLLQLCRYVLFHCTFNHTWTHDGQYDAGGELAYATFGLRNGSLGDESDTRVAPTPASMIEGIGTNTIGTRANYGYILPDEEHDVPPALKAALSKRRAAFSELGVDVEKIRSRINI